MNDNQTNETAEFGTSEINRNGLTITVGATRAAAPSGDEWVRLASRHQVGDRLHGKVVNFKPYGFFVETDEEKFFGLVHESLIRGWKKGPRFDAVFHLGQEVDVEITKIDPEAHRMAFAYEMPEDEPESDEPAEEEEISVPALETPALSHGDAARQWTEENAEASEAAKKWLREELETGPVYGPLANVLSDRFDVPVPVSFWIRQFPEFTCFIGKGDNPSGLPAVALTARVGDGDYWKSFKSRASDLSSGRSQEDEDVLKYGRVALRMDGRPFPGSRWIGDFRTVSAQLAECREIYRASDTLERLVIPLLEQMGLVSDADTVVPPRLVRGGRDDLGGDSPFDLCLYAGNVGEGHLALAACCAAAGTSFRDLKNRGGDPNALSNRNVIERVLGACNRQRGYDEGRTKIVWTDGCEWVVFSEQALARRIGILSDRSGERILAETAASDVNDWFRRIVFPASGRPLDWLAAFADLQEALA